jgi:hypothetical protein
METALKHYRVQGDPATFQALEQDARQTNAATTKEELTRKFLAMWARGIPVAVTVTVYKSGHCPDSLHIDDVDTLREFVRRMKAG